MANSNLYTSKNKKRFSLKSLSIKRKMIMIIMIITTFSLILSSVVFLIFDYYTYKESMEEDLEAVATTIASYNSVTIPFRDKKTAKSYLETLKRDKRIVAAGIYAPSDMMIKSEDWSLWIEYYADTSLPEDVLPSKISYEANGSNFGAKDDMFQLFMDIPDEDDNSISIGKLCIVANLEEFNDRLRNYVLVVLLVVIGSVLIAFYLSSRLQLLISKPLLFLTYKAREISVNKDYSIRIRKYTNDEVGALIDSFNEMLVEIEKQSQTIYDQLGLITQVNKQMTDSINYAKRIQEAILPDLKLLSKFIPESFVLYKPKDIVSGDFYWYYKRGPELLVASVDCTGHGVPGAFMSLIGTNVLNRVVNLLDDLEVDNILNRLNAGVKIALKQDRVDSETQDGMDIALAKINLETKEVCFAGANRPLYYFKNGTFKEIKGDKYPIGGNQFDEDILFERKTIQLEEGDMIYLFSDGFPDQFGGNNDKKYSYRRMRDILKKNHDKSMSEQENALDMSFQKWKGASEQTDDVLVMGFKM